jgi:PAS domain S-box-containing protein
MDVKVAIIDEDERFSRWAVRALMDRGFDAWAAKPRADAVERALARVPNLLFIDVSEAVGSIDGISLAADILRRRDVPIVFLCDLPEWEGVERRARLVSDYGFFVKGDDDLAWNFSEIARLAYDRWRCRDRAEGSRAVAPECQFPSFADGRFLDPALEGLPLPIALKDSRSAVLARNRAWRDLEARPGISRGLDDRARGDAPAFKVPVDASIRAEALLLERGGSIGFEAVASDSSRWHIAKTVLSSGTDRFALACAYPDRRAQADDAPSAESADLRRILDRTPAYLAAFDLDGRFTFANAAYASVFGLEPDGLVGRTLGELMPASLAEHFVHALRKAAASEEPIKDSGRMPVGGQVRAMSNLYFRLSDSEDGPRVGIIGTDVTELVEREKSLEIAERRNAQLVEELGRKAEEMSALVELGREISSSLSVERVLERVALRAHRLLCRHTTAVFTIDDSDGMLHAASCAGAAASELSTEVFPPGDGILGSVVASLRTVVSNDLSADERGVRIPGTPPDRRGDKLLAVPLSDGDDALGVLAIWRGPDERAFDDGDVDFASGLARSASLAMLNARAFEAAREAQGEAERANRMKSGFLANVSHELRTPLNAIINFAYLLSIGAEGEISEGQRDMLQRVEQSGRHLLELIGDLLDLAKIESGKLELSYEPVHIARLAADAGRFVAPMLSGRSVRFENLVDEGLPPILADRKQIGQVLINLASNAAKFTESGRITVSARVEASRVVVSVSDTGIGIGREDADRVFDEFTQVDGSLARRFRGSGLGLPISKRFVELHGGTMWVDSKPGQGSVFSFSLPIT